MQADLIVFHAQLPGIIAFRLPGFLGFVIGYGQLQRRIIAFPHEYLAGSGGHQRAQVIKQFAAGVIAAIAAADDDIILSGGMVGIEAQMIIRKAFDFFNQVIHGRLFINGYYADAIAWHIQQHAQLGPLLQHFGIAVSVEQQLQKLLPGRADGIFPIAFDPQNSGFQNIEFIIVFLPVRAAETLRQLADGTAGAGSGRHGEGDEYESQNGNDKADLPEICKHRLRKNAGVMKRAEEKASILRNGGKKILVGLQLARLGLAGSRGDIPFKQAFIEGLCIQKAVFINGVA